MQPAFDKARRAMADSPNTATPAAAPPDAALPAAPRHDGERAALQIELLRRQLALRDLEVRAKERELASADKQKGWKIDAVTAAIIAGLIGFLSSVVSTHLQGRHSLKLEDAKAVATRELESEKFRASRTLENDKFRTSLILEASKTGDPEKAARNLEFFLALGYIDDPSGKIAQQLRERRGPVLPAATERAPSGDPVPATHVPATQSDQPGLQELARAVGSLWTGERYRCNAWIVSAEHVLTTDYCAAEIRQAKQGATLRMGAAPTPGGQAGAAAPAKFAVDAEDPADLNMGLGYAVLRVKDNPAAHFGAVPLAVRPAQMGEPLLLIYHSPDDGLSYVGMGPPCHVRMLNQSVRVTRPDYSAHRGGSNNLGHRCFEGVASLATVAAQTAGALVVAASDLSPVGVQHSAGFSMAFARQTDSILAASGVLREIAAAQPKSAQPTQTPAAQATKR